FFPADPVAGFPPGTPASTVAVSWHGLLHLVCAAVGFLALISACGLFARRFAWLGERVWVAFSAAAGAAFLAGVLALVFVQGETPGTSGGGAILGFWVALALVWSWLSALSVRLSVEVAQAEGEDRSGSGPRPRSAGATGIPSQAKSSLAPEHAGGSRRIPP